MKAKWGSMGRAPDTEKVLHRYWLQLLMVS